MQKGFKLKLVCDTCGCEYDKDIKYFKKYSYKSPETGHSFHTTCRKCEEKQAIEKEYKDGKLLCHICGEYLDPEKFDLTDHYPLRNNMDSRCHQCKVKQNKKARTAYSDDKRLIKVLQSRYLSARNRASKKNITFSITEQYLKYLWDKQNGLCAISGIPMTYELDKGRIYTNVSIDQIEPGMGYVEGNVQLICMGVNQMKSDWSMETLLYMCKSIIEHQKTINNN